MKPSDPWEETDRKVMKGIDRFAGVACLVIGAGFVLGGHWFGLAFLAAGYLLAVWGWE